MICDLLNLVSIPSLNPYKYLHQQYQLSHLQSQTNKRVSYSSFYNTICTFFLIDFILQTVEKIRIILKYFIIEEKILV